MKLRWALLALIALVAIGGALTQARPVENHQVATQSDCHAAKRVTLLVDFGDSRKLQVACAANFNGTGWQLFAATNTLVSGTDQYPEGFVCRIDGHPNEATQGCHGTPTYSAGGWAYFYKSVETKNKWVFSPTGSSLRHPACGSIEGWRYFRQNQSPSKTAPRSNLSAFKC